MTHLHIINNNVSYNDTAIITDFQPCSDDSHLVAHASRLVQALCMHACRYFKEAAQQNDGAALANYG